MSIGDQSLRGSRFLYWCSLLSIFSGAIAVASCMYICADAQVYQALQNRRLNSAIDVALQPAREMSRDPVPTATRAAQRLAGLKFRGWRFRLSFSKVTIRKLCDGAPDGFREPRGRANRAISPLPVIAILFSARCETSGQMMSYG